MPSRSEGWGGLFKDEQYRLIRSASRKSIRSLRVFEQTAPPSLREGTPPNSGGDWSTVYTKPGLHRIHYIQTFTRRHSAPFILSWWNPRLQSIDHCRFPRFQLQFLDTPWHIEGLVEVGVGILGLHILLE